MAGSSDSEDSLLNELCAEYEELSQETLKADGLRQSSESEDEDLASTVSQQQQQQNLWWVDILKRHSPPPGETALQQQRLLRQTRLRILSGCTGLCAEAEVLKAGNREQYLLVTVIL